VPFCETEKSSFDKLVDILTVIPLALSASDAVAALGDDPTPQARDGVTTDLLEIRRGLAEWWTEHTCELIQEAGLNSPSYIKAVDAHLTTSSRVTALYDDPFEAESRALYDTGIILVSHAQILISPQLDSTTLREEIVAHSSSILRAVDYIERQEVWKDAGGPFRLTYPLKVVRDTSPNLQQSQDADAFLTSWRKRRGINTDWTCSKSCSIIKTPTS
jgi:hypothetical protein